MGLFTPDVTSGAVLSPCGQYRYRLWRDWGPGGLCAWVMLNPSTADADKDDATIRKCVGFARRWGYGGIHVVNLAAWRATNPDELWNVESPVSEPGKPQCNFEHMLDAFTQADAIIAAWGVPGARFAHSASMLESLKQKWPAKLRVLGFNQNGTPKHPLMVGYGVPAVPVVQ